MIEAAASRQGMPYRIDPPPDGVNNTDCSQYVLLSYEDAGIPFSGVRTAEQIRQACLPLGWGNIQRADLLFFEHTYLVNEPPAADGHVASHIGISLGAGSYLMWNAVEPSVTITRIDTPYWQDKLFEARIAPSLLTAPETPVGEVTAIDVSNYQPPNPCGLARTYGASHVIVKLYQTIEVDGAREHAATQIAAAKNCGCSVGGYVWLYAGVDPEQQVADALSLYVPPILWLDVEPYVDGSCPSVAEIQWAVDYCQRIGQRVGIYSGKWVWDRLGNPTNFSHLPLWTAEFNGDASLDGVTLYGGWQEVAGHQWTSEPVDRNVMRADVTV